MSHRRIDTQIGSSGNLRCELLGLSGDHRSGQSLARVEADDKAVCGAAGLLRNGDTVKPMGLKIAPRASTSV
jgi:hypothetical protein